MKQIEPRESDIVLDTPGYGARCVICGAKEVDNDDGPIIRTFSFGDAENTVYCSGVMFLCEEHRDDDLALSALIAKVSQLALVTGIVSMRGARA